MLLTKKRSSRRRKSKTLTKGLTSILFMIQVFNLRTSLNDPGGLELWSAVHPDYRRPSVVGKNPPRHCSQSKSAGKLGQKLVPKSCTQDYFVVDFVGRAFYNTAPSPSGLSAIHCDCGPAATSEVKCPIFQSCRIEAHAGVEW